jgi:hypothetical protein
METLVNIGIGIVVLLSLFWVIMLVRDIIKYIGDVHKNIWKYSYMSISIMTIGILVFLSIAYLIGSFITYKG